MAVFRGGPGYRRARWQHKTGYYPVSDKNDTSTLWGDIEDTRNQPGFTPDLTVSPGNGWIQGDYLVFGVTPLWVCIATFAGMIAGLVASYYGIYGFFMPSPGSMTLTPILVVAWALWLFFFFTSSIGFFSLAPNL